MSRFRRHLSDKLEIEAETMKKVKTSRRRSGRKTRACV
jgi:hypothetical protein